MNKLLDRAVHFFLFLGFLIGALAIYRLRFDSLSQFWVVLALVVFYIVWGFVYHSLKKDLTSKLLLEYLVTAAIASVAGFLVFRA